MPWPCALSRAPCAGRPQSGAQGNCAALLPRRRVQRLDQPARDRLRALDAGARGRSARRSRKAVRLLRGAPEGFFHQRRGCGARAQCRAPGARLARRQQADRAVCPQARPLAAAGPSFRSIGDRHQRGYRRLQARRRARLSPCLVRDQQCRLRGHGRYRSGGAQGHRRPRARRPRAAPAAAAHIREAAGDRRGPHRRRRARCDDPAAGGVFQEAGPDRGGRHLRDGGGALAGDEFPDQPSARQPLRRPRRQGQACGRRAVGQPHSYRVEDLRTYDRRRGGAGRRARDGAGGDHRLCRATRARKPVGGNTGATADAVRRRPRRRRQGPEASLQPPGRLAGRTQPL